MMLRSEVREGIALFLFAGAAYLLMSYGGIRSPDGEVVFRAAEHFASTGRIDVPERLEHWTAFGVAAGRDGRLYSVFGPGQSIAAVPFIWLGTILDRAQWHDRATYIPPSHYLGDGLPAFVGERSPAQRGAHALRSIACLLNVVAGALGALVFWLCARQVTRNRAAALAAWGLYAFGTLAWWYAGTFFSEPLTTLFVLLSLLLLLRSGGNPDDRVSAVPALLASGLLLGIATLVHISAILFLPFFAAGALRRETSANSLGIGGKRRALAFLTGAAAPLALLALHNIARFGDALETGRNVDAAIAIEAAYGTFTTPWRGLYGLLLGSGKGLLIYSPAIVLGMIGWPALRRARPGLAWLLAGAAAARLLFISMRTDWHGGYCMGPRLMVIALPLVLLPVAPWLAESIERCDRRSLAAFSAGAFVCIAEQIHLALGEVFSFYQALRVAFDEANGINLFRNDRLHLDWEFSPLTHMLTWKRGPFLLHGVPVSNHALLVALALAAGLLVLALHRALVRTIPAEHRAPVVDGRAELDGRAP